MPKSNSISSDTSPLTHVSGDIPLNGKYQALACLGEGTEGRVLLAQDISTGSNVAVKVTLDNESSHNESQFLSLGLNHKNLVQAVDQFEENDSKHFVLEYVKTDLFEVMNTCEYLSTSQLRHLGKNVLQGLLEVHKNGFAHRDIKPENILLSSEIVDDQCDIKLTDFGFVHNINERPLADTFCGSAGYVAPEVLALEEYDPIAADVWSVGIVMYCALTTIAPWEVAKEEDQIFACYSNAPATFWEWSKNYSEQAIPESFRDLFEGMCAMDPNNRLAVEECLRHPFFTDF